MSRHTAEPVLLCSVCFQQERDVPASLVVNGFSVCSEHHELVMNHPAGLVWRS